MKQKQEKFSPIPAPLQTAFDQMEVSLNEVTQLIGTDITDQLREELQRISQGLFEAKSQAYDLGYRYHERTEEVDQMEGNIGRLEGILEKLGSSDLHSKMVALRDPANWTGNSWTPYLGSTERDILTYLDQAFAEVV